MTEHMKTDQAKCLVRFHIIKFQKQLKLHNSKTLDELGYDAECFGSS